MKPRAQPQTAAPLHIPAPVGGLNTVDAGYEMPATDAPVLFNVIAAENGLRSRLGYKEFATNVGSGMVPTVMPYAGSSWDGTKDRLFATTSTTLYDVTAGGSSPTSKLTFSSSSGDAGWGVSHAVVNSAGAHFLTYCDEVNGYHVYTESTDTWAAVAAGGWRDADQRGYAGQPRVRHRVEELRSVRREEHERCGSARRRTASTGR
jgi:hypothetical protein